MLTPTSSGSQIPNTIRRRRRKLQRARRASISGTPFLDVGHRGKSGRGNATVRPIDHPGDFGEESTLSGGDIRLGWTATLEEAWRALGAARRAGRVGRLDRGW